MQLTPDAGVAAVGVPGWGRRRRAAVAVGTLPQQSPRALSNDAPTMLAQPAPDAAAIARAQAEAQQAASRSGDGADAAAARSGSASCRRVRPKASRRRPLPAVAGRCAVARTTAISFAALAAAGARRRRCSCGCAARGNVAVTVTTDPRAPRCYDGERLVGTAPAVVKVPRGGEPHRCVKKDGYLTAQRVVDGTEIDAQAAAAPKPPPSEKAGAAAAGAAAEPVHGRAAAEAASARSRRRTSRAAPKPRRPRKHPRDRRRKHADSHAVLLVLWQIPDRVDGRKHAKPEARVRESPVTRTPTCTTRRKLRALFERWHAELHAADAALGRALRRLSRDAGRGARRPQALSDLLVELAPTVSRFVARLFRVEDEWNALRERDRRGADVFRFKDEFVKRRALKRKPDEGTRAGRRQGARGARPARRAARRRAQGGAGDRAACSIAKRS